MMIIEPPTDENEMKQSPVYWINYLKDNWSPKHTKYAITIGVMGFFFLFLLCFAGLVVWYLAQSGLLLKFLNWVDSIGSWGYFVVICCIVFINFPFTAGYSILMMSSGAIFGWVRGVVTVAIGCQIGILLIFLLVRIPYFRRKSMNYIESKAYIKALLEELTRRQTFFAILVRTTPLPLGIQNVVLSSTKISWWQYHVTSFLGLLIEQIPVVYIGASAKKLASIIAGDVKISWYYIAALLFSGVGVCIFCGLVLVFARNALLRVKKREQELMEQQSEITNTPSNEIIEVELDLEECKNTSANINPEMVLNLDEQTLSDSIVQKEIELVVCGSDGPLHEDPCKKIMNDMDAVDLVNGDGEVSGLPDEEIVDSLTEENEIFEMNDEVSTTEITHSEESELSVNVLDVKNNLNSDDDSANVICELP